MKLHGPLLALDHLAKKVGLHEILGDYSREILSMVYAHCLDYKSVNQMERWFARTDLAMILSEESRLAKTSRKQAKLAGTPFAAYPFAVAWRKESEN